jgi:hypothetical protein
LSLAAHLIIYQLTPFLGLAPIQQIRRLLLWWFGRSEACAGGSARYRIASFPVGLFSDASAHRNQNQTPNLVEGLLPSMRTSSLHPRHMAQSEQLASARGRSPLQGPSDSPSLAMCARCCLIASGCNRPESSASARPPQEDLDLAQAVSQLPCTDQRLSLVIRPFLSSSSYPYPYPYPLPYPHRARTADSLSILSLLYNSSSLGRS